MDTICNEYITGQRRWEGLERKRERQDRSGLDMHGGNIMRILGEGCRLLNCLGGGQNGCLLMR